MNDVEDATSTVTDVALLTQAARAEVARLSLAVRTARRDAEQAEREAADLDGLTRNAEAFLEASLEELVEARRSACEQDLSEERAVAEAVVADAREEAARVAALALEEAAAREEARRRTEAYQELPVPPAPPLRLRVVGSGALAEPARHPAFAAAEPVAAGEPESAPAAEPVVGAASIDPRLGSDMALLPADELRELVRAAVVVGLREAMEQAAAMVHLTAPLARPVAPEVQPARDRVVEPAVDEAPFWRRFLHLDVLLPLVAALIVIVLFVAWIG